MLFLKIYMNQDDRAIFKLRSALALYRIGAFKVSSLAE